jgi:hypothetical protein
MPTPVSRSRAIAQAASPLCTTTRIHVLVALLELDALGADSRDDREPALRLHARCRWREDEPSSPSSPSSGVACALAVASKAESSARFQPREAPFQLSVAQRPGELFPRPPPDGFPVVLGAFGGAPLSLVPPPPLLPPLEPRPPPPEPLPPPLPLLILKLVFSGSTRARFGGNWDCFFGIPMLDLDRRVDLRRLACEPTAGDDAVHAGAHEDAASVAASSVAAASGMCTWIV